MKIISIVNKFLEELHRFINRLALRLIGWLIRLISRKGLEKLEIMMIRHIERCGDDIFTYHRRPRSTSQIETWSDIIRSLPSVAIVIQGGLVEAHDFTFETVRLYRRLHPEAILVVSTWEDSDPDYVERIKQLGAEVLLNEKPSYFGVKNINLQIVSSHAGVDYARSKGVEYVLKTRTDQRFYAPNVIAFLVSMLDAFPARGDHAQVKRILGVSLNTFKYRMYGLSDMFYFGMMEDMVKFWQCPLDSRSLEEVPHNTNVREYAEACFCEVYLMVNYLKKIGFDMKWTLADSFRAFSDVFVVIDKESIDLVWTKYSNREYWYLAYDAIRTNQELNFREWLMLHRWETNIEVDDRCLDYKITQKIEHLKQ